MHSQPRADRPAPIRIRVTEDAYVGPPATVTVEEINRVTAARREMTKEEKKALGTKAWASILAGDVRFKEHATDG